MGVCVWQREKGGVEMRIPEKMKTSDIHPSNSADRGYQKLNQEEFSMVFFSFLHSFISECGWKKKQRKCGCAYVCVCGGGERERKKETERHRDRETPRQTEAEGRVCVS